MQKSDRNYIKFDGTAWTCHEIMRSSDLETDPQKTANANELPFGLFVSVISSDSVPSPLTEVADKQSWCSGTSRWPCWSWDPGGG